MTNLRKSIIIGLTVLGLGTTGMAVQAQSAQPQGARAAGAMSMEQHHAKWNERRAEHEKKLHDMLKLTPSQNVAWTTYLAAVKPARHEGERHARGEPGAMAAPQRMEQRIAMAKQHLGRMEAQLGALNTFYAVLTPEQKKVFDEQSMRHGKGGRHMGRHRMQG